MLIGLGAASLPLRCYCKLKSFPLETPQQLLARSPKPEMGRLEGKAQKARGMRRKQQEGFLGRVRGWEDTP